MGRANGCLREDEVTPKRRHTEYMARVSASELSEIFKGTYEAYRCPTCGYWHTGRRPTRTNHRRISGNADFALLIWDSHELGTRAAANLKEENSRSPHKRRESLFKRFVGARKQRIGLTTPHGRRH